MSENYNSDTSRFLWNCNADVWIALNDSGNNYFREFVTNPAFFSMLPNVKNKDGIDIGCGHGHNTRLLKFEEMVEPKARIEDVVEQPALQGAEIVPRFEIIRCVKPG